MAINFEIKDRRVVPNWRDFRRTILLNELGAAGRKDRPLNISIDRALLDWQIDKSIGTAADLVNSAFISGVNNFQEIDEAIKYVIDNPSQASKTLLELTTIVSHTRNGEDKPRQSNLLLEIPEIKNSELEFLRNEALIRKIINKTRNKSFKELRNPINWIELARLYSIVGQLEKGENAMTVALQLAPNNRFVLRSATRFFIHFDKHEKALFYLRKSLTLKTDPWLISAHIATSSILKRYSPVIKNGLEILKSKDFSNYDITELASSIGTLELEAGSFKRSQGFFEQALLKPNDNSLAQIEWASREDKRLVFNPFSFTEVVNPFEAFAYDDFQKGNWKESFQHCLKWSQDIPYSKRPVLLGSYIAGNFLDNFDIAIRFCELGLKANPNDADLLNNLLYFVARTDRLNEYKHYLQRFSNLNLKEQPDESKIFIQATFGLIAFRSNQIELGKALYKKAISNAEKLKDEKATMLAVVNYTRELIKSNDIEKEKYINIIKAYTSSDSEKELKHIVNEVLEFYNRQNRVLP